MCFRSVSSPKMPSNQILYTDNFLLTEDQFISYSQNQKKKSSKNGYGCSEFAMALFIYFIYYFVSIYYILLIFVQLLYLSDTNFFYAWKMCFQLLAEQLMAKRR